MELTLLSEHVEPATAVSMGMPGAAPGGRPWQFSRAGAPLAALRVVGNLPSYS